MGRNVFCSLNGRVGFLTIAAAAIVSTSAAHAQAGIYPDGSMWVNTPSGTTWTNPAGSVKVDKTGHVVDVSPSCKDVQSINVQQAKSVCWKVGNKYLVFEVGYVLYTCFDTGASVAQRITSYVQATGRPCDPADEATDRGEAQLDWQESWPVTTVAFPPNGGGSGDGGQTGGTQSTGGDQGTQSGGGSSGTPTGSSDGTQTGSGGGTQTGGGAQTGGGSQTGGGTQTGSQTGGAASGPPGTGQPLIGGWPAGADWVRSTSGGWLIHYPDGRTVEQGPDGKIVEQTPSSQQSNAQSQNGTATGDKSQSGHAGSAASTTGNSQTETETPHKNQVHTETKKKHPTKAASETSSGPGSNAGAPNAAVEDLIGFGVGVGLGMGHGMHGGDKGMGHGMDR